VEEESSNTEAEDTPLTSLLKDGKIDYCKVMGNYQFSTASIDYSKHHYVSQILSSEKMSAKSKKMIRLMSEMSALSSSLPLSESSSVFARCDQSRLDVMKVMIVGPQGTPYENGLFEFDIFFNQNYPQAPPDVNLCTTGGGTVRFNPNLYECGKVCLSLLGTWSGGVEEQWNPSQSTLLQVLVSAQSLILVPEPFFNEPGWEVYRGTHYGDDQSGGYSENIRVQTMQHAMIGQLRNPPPEFADVVALHFWLKKDEILKQCERWRQSSNTMKTQMEATITNLTAELLKLPRPAQLPG